MKNWIRTGFLIFVQIAIISSCLSQNTKDETPGKMKKKQESSVQEKRAGEPKNEIIWYSFEEAVKKNLTYPKKKIFIDVYTHWCGWCKKMDAETFKNPEIVKYINEHYYAVKLNAERKDTVKYNGQVFVNPQPNAKRSAHQLAISLLQRKMTYPSYVFLNEDNQMLTAVRGFMKPENFEPVIHYFGDNAHNKMSWENFQKSFKGKLFKNSQ